MARAEQLHHNPLGTIPEWTGRHWKSLSTFAIIALGGTGYAIHLTRPLNSDTQKATPVPVSDTFNRPDQKPGFIIEKPAALTPNPTETRVPTITVIPLPTEPPKPKIGYESTDQNFIYRTEKGDILNVPQIEGLKAELLSAEDGREKIIYRSLETNKYGLEANIYAGEYVPNVKMTGEDSKEKQAGGLVLTAPVVRQLINEKLATIPNQKDKWIVPLPIDPRGLDINNIISVKFEKAAIGKFIATMRFEGKAPLVNILLSSTQLRIMAGGTYGGGYLDPIRLMDSYADKIFPGKEMQYFTVAGNLEGFSENTTIKSSFGEKVGLGRNFVIVGHSAAFETDDTTVEKILTVNDIPVFLATN